MWFSATHINTVIPAKAGIQLLTLPNFFRLAARYFLEPPRKYPKKRPLFRRFYCDESRNRTALRCSQPSAPAELALAARGLRQSSATSPQAAALLGFSKGEAQVKTVGARRPSVLTSEAFRGPLKRRRGAQVPEGAVAEDCLSFASTQSRQSEFRSRPQVLSTSRAPRSEAEGRCDQGCVFFAYFLFAQAKESESP